ncbi:hypothetical protein GMLC_39150 [Geomonas limicola]|uniref:MBG domain-containing protein n=1 Tax=Geomonas limicola TaxID=2740186 RepID=A0A6V8NCS6_9BACT|nr:MBG domain-containing protein [Geomonas limicola]GFO70336.1 hypothetical protein GMLC_39150 [Geomonas limicola]
MNVRIVGLVLLLVGTFFPASLPGYTGVDGFLTGNAGPVSLSGVAVEAVVVQPWDAKIVIGGDFSITGGTPSVTLTNLARLNPDGTLDTSFAPPPPNGPVRALALQPDPDLPAAAPHLLVGGDFTQLGGAPRRGLARVASSDGTLDPFDPVSTSTPVRVHALALMPDGRGLVVGGAFAELVAGTPSANLARVSVASSDPGASAWNLGTPPNAAVNAVLLAGGKLLLGGDFTAPRAGLVRLSLTGAPDPGFAAPDPGGSVFALALQGDGKVLVGGTFAAGALGGGFLARLAGDGTPDAGFGAAPNAAVRSIVVRPDGKIVVGGDFTTISGSAAGRLARLSRSGLWDTTLFPLLDAPVRALALQPDGKLLAGGAFSLAGARTRTRLARFYPGGALDDDLAAANLALDWAVSAISPSPDGTITFAGLFTTVQGQTRNYLARLKEDLNLTEPANFDPTLRVNGAINAMTPLPDHSYLVGGRFLQVNGVPQKILARFDARGSVNADPQIAAFNAAIKALAMTDQIAVILPLPKGSTLPNGSAIPDGSFYLGGRMTATASPYRYLARFRNDGSRDPSFSDPPELDSVVYTVVLQPDQKLLVGTNNGKLLRLKNDGQLDTSVTGMMSLIMGLVLQPDGKLLVSGGGPAPPSVPDWERTLVRLNPDLSIDHSFRVETMTLFDGYTVASTVMRTDLQADGGMIIYGVFDHVRDATGTSYYRDCVARIRPDGTVDPDFDLGPLVYHGSTIIGQVNTVNLQPDGKLLLGGDFDSVNGNGLKRMARYAYGWAAESLAVAADGSGATWRRCGTAPELREVWFEYCEDPETPEASWTFLGYGERVAGGWRIGNLNLGQYGLRANRYLRAQGRVAGDRGSGGTLMESVLLYYLDPPQQATITVSADAQTKRYGDADPPLTFSFTPPLAPGDSFTGALSRVPGETVGLYAIGQGTLSAGANYEVTFQPGTLIISERNATLTGNDGTKSYGEPDPVLVATQSGLLPADLGPGRIQLGASRVPGENVGSYQVSARADDGGSGLLNNYQLSYLAGNFTVTQAPLMVRADDQARAYRTPNPPLTVSYQGFVRGETPAVLAGEPQLATTATPESAVGSYPITVATGSLAAANYRFTLQDGVLSVVRSCQEIVFPPLAERTYGDPPFELNATACSGLALNFTSSNPQVAQVNGRVLSITGAGNAVIGAAQPGSSDLDPAPPVTRTLVVHRAGQTLEFAPVAAHRVGDPPFTLSARASSALPVSFQSSDPGVAEVVGNQVTVKGAGTAVLTALQGGDANFNPALPVPQALSVAPESEPPQLELSTLSSGSATANPVLNLSGQARDNVGVASLTVNGVALPDPQSPFSWAVPLTPGNNLVEVLVRDAAGNSTGRTLNVTLDAAAPEILLVAPADNSIVGGGELALTGSVTPGSELSVVLNGAPALPVTVQPQTGVFSFLGALAQGNNTVELTARRAGRSACLKRSLDWRPGLPALAIDEPGQDLRTELASLVVRGSVGAGVTAVTLEAGGTSYTPVVQGGRFEQRITLPAQGVVSVVARALDPLAGVSLTRRNIVKVELIRGDLNGDGCIDLFDAQLALQASLGLEPVSAALLAHGDVAPLVDGAPRPDGRIDAGDVLVIMRKIVGLVDF